MKSLLFEYIKFYLGDYLGYWELFNLRYKDLLKDAESFGYIDLGSLLNDSEVKNAIALNPSLKDDYNLMIRDALDKYDVYVTYPDIHKIQELIRVSKAPPPTQRSRPVVK